MLTLKEKERAAYLAGDAELATTLQAYEDLRAAASRLVELAESGDLETVADRLALYDQCDRVRELL